MQANTKRARDRDDSAPPGLSPGRSAAAVTSISKRLKRATNNPQDLTDQDLAELYKILQRAIVAHSERHGPTAPMLDAFVEAIFRDWSAHPHLIAPPGVPARFPYREDGDGFDDRLYEFQHYDLTPAEKEAIERKHPNSTDAYYGLELCFIDKKKSMHLFLHYRASDGERKNDELRIVDLPLSVHDHFAKEMMEFFGKVCDEHNEPRAVQYARAYIQDKALSKGREGRIRDYSFEQVSDIYDEFQDLVDFCRWVPDLDEQPTLFGQVAESI